MYARTLRRRRRPLGARVLPPQTGGYAGPSATNDFVASLGGVPQDNTLARVAPSASFRARARVHVAFRPAPCAPPGLP